MENRNIELIQQLKSICTAIVDAKAISKQHGIDLPILEELEAAKFQTEKAIKDLQKT